MLKHAYRATTHGWFDSRPVKETFLSFLSPLIGMPCKIMEIGCWEGVSTCSFLDVLGPKAAIVCIDPFTGSKEHNSPTHLEESFDYNVSLGGHTGKVTKLKQRSEYALPQLLVQDGERESYDFIYVDGSHIARDVLADAVLAFPLLKVEGIVVFDDYLWTDLPDELDRPRIAVNAFVNIYGRSIKVLHADYRVFARRIAK